MGISDGGVKFGVTLQNAIIRETKEEFDIEIADVEFLMVFDHILPEEKQHWVALSYISKLVSGNTKINDPEKCLNFKWVKLSEIRSETLSIKSQSIYQKFIEKYGLDKVF